MKDSDDSDEDAHSSDVSSRVSGDEARGSPTTSKSDLDSESSGIHGAGGHTVADNEYGGGQTTSDEDPGGQTPADQLVKKQQRAVNETDGGKAPSSGCFSRHGMSIEEASSQETTVRPV